MHKNISEAYFSSAKAVNVREVNKKWAQNKAVTHRETQTQIKAFATKSVNDKAQIEADEIKKKRAKYMK